MGVEGLWNILLTVATKKDITDFSGYRIAIDASIWIMKVNSILESDASKLKSIFKKIVWLKKHNIKPIFVFDGTSPALKRKTLQERRQRRRQLNDLDIKKKAQIELLRQIQNKADPKKKEMYAQNRKKISQKLKQTDTMLAQLIVESDSIGGIQLEEKTQLQGELLDKKYQLFCDISDNVAQKYGLVEEFSRKQLEEKIHLLDEIQMTDLSSGNYRNFRKQLTEQEKIIYDMELNKKKAKIRQLQDKLYRKISQKRIQNGYQIIETIQNGRKLLQKRRIQPKDQSNFDFYLRGKKTQLSNDFKGIFENRREEEEQQNQTKVKGDFFANIFNRDYQKPASQESNFEQIKRKSQNSQQYSQSKNSKRSSSPSYFSSSSSSNRSEDSSKSLEFSEPDLQLFSGDLQQNKAKFQFQKDPDQFPDFIKNQELYSLPTSNDNIQVQNLLKMLGIEFIIAQTQAEAECASLEQNKIVDAVATEDSDVFLFGGRTILRGLFQDNIKLYSMSNIERNLMLTRDKMILLAMMLGSDYTQGIKGIGIVNAMQIVKVYGTLNELRKLTEWAQTSDTLQSNDSFKTDNMLLNSESAQQAQFYRLHRKYKTYWHVNPSFPEASVYNAYMKPDVIELELIKSKLKDQTKIQIELLQTLMREKFGMGQEQIKHSLKCVNKKFERNQQRAIDDYLGVGELAKIRSKRLKNAINS